MTRILVQRGGGGSSLSNSSQSRSSSAAASSSSSATSLPVPPAELSNFQPLFVPEDEHHNFEGLGDGLSYQDCTEIPYTLEVDEAAKELAACEIGSAEENYDGSHVGVDLYGNASSIGVSGLELGEIDVGEKTIVEEDNREVQCEKSSGVQVVSSCSCPPPPPVPPPKPGIIGLGSRRIVSSGSAVQRSGSSRRQQFSWNAMASRTSPTGSRPSSPRSYGDGEGYNSADEQSTCFGSYDDAERERQFESDIRHARGFEVRRMAADGNCLFRAVADQVYGDAELYDHPRQMCIDYMEKERDHFSPFVTEGFTAYCKRKRRDKVYGNNMEIQAMSEMYNRPIHIYIYSIEPINIFHGSYNTDSPPIRLSYHRGNHYNSLVDPHRLAIGAGLGFSSLQGANIDKDQVKAALKAQQDQQIENALLAEGRFYSDLELTEKEIERTVMEASRAEYLRTLQQHGGKESSTSGAEPSSSSARTSTNDHRVHLGDFQIVPDRVVTKTTSGNPRMKGKAAEILSSARFEDDFHGNAHCLNASSGKLIPQQMRL
ncbi:hypothetical protein SUGI_1191150 [Cryptomeria japonica]|nr:hypothetical protein SUGI_1191150 [Cryptomeria japonica]